MSRRLMLAAAALVLGNGVANAQEAIRDPFESFNRAMFSFNDSVDHVALEPAARGYRAITPRFVRTGVSNALSNISAPVTFANDVLQAEPGRAGTTLVRFGVNTTIGVAGLFDVAKGMGLERHTEDFGQTLGRWGVGSGPYLVLPLLGPSSLRDAPGRAVDVAFQPLNYAQFDGDDGVRIGRAVLSAVSAREGALDVVDDMRASSIDPYVSTRSAYSLLRESAIHNGQTDVKDLPDFDSNPSETDDAGPAPVQPPPQGNQTQ